MPNLDLRIPSLAALLVMVGCSSSTPTPSSDPPGPGDPAAETNDYLRDRLTAFAADSMGGRAAGSAGHQQATAFLAAEAESLGLEPAGEGGTYFQQVPLATLQPVADASVGGIPVELGGELVLVAPIEGFAHDAVGDMDGVEVVYGGRMFGPDQIDGAQGQSKVVVLGAGLQGGTPVFGIAPQVLDAFSGSVAVLIAALDYTTPDIVAALGLAGMRIADEPMAESGPMLGFITNDLAARLLGSPVEDATPGAAGTPFQGQVGFEDVVPEHPTANVIALLPGSDPDLRSEVVVVSAHSDHVAPTDPVADHDSLRVYLEVVRPRGAEDPEREPTPAEAEQIAELLEGMDRGAPRPDSIFNGADDDGSGSIGMLQIARSLSADPPRRSVLFVWHTGEEVGLLGAQYFTDNPTIPRGDMVAGLNLDMIGRGGADDVDGGGPGYIQLIGSRRLSTQLGDLVETVNLDADMGFSFDYTYDVDGHPDNFYCRSDHYMYARYGIPIVFFSTGGHRDYHQLTDEPEYIDYDKLRRVTALVAAVADGVANMDERVVVDGPIPDPDAPCQQ